MSRAPAPSSRQGSLGRLLPLAVVLVAAPTACKKPVPQLRFDLQADAARLRSTAERVIDAFLGRLAKLGAPARRRPTAEVKTRPSLISWRHRTHRIRLPLWKQVPAQQQAVFVRWAGSRPAARRIFAALFHWFFIPHELTHYLQGRFRVRFDHFRSENRANQLAVAFWKTQPGGERRLRALHDLLKPLLGRLRNPAPAGVSARAYFNQNYDTLGRYPDRYGYYQINMVARALEARAGLDFDDLVKRWFLGGRGK